MPTIFYSWQSDLPNRTNRAFIRSALDDAVKRFNEQQTASVHDAARDDLLQVDQDTQGVPGSPHITETIFAKIAEATAFVADVSFVVQGDSRRCPNPNVMIELGYALAKLGAESVLTVMNVAYGRPEELPFDMRHRRYPLQFELLHDSDSDTKRKAMQQLIQGLAERLRPILERKPGRAPESHGENDGSSTFADQTKGIDIDFEGRRQRLKPIPRPRIFAHLAPQRRIELDRADALAALRSSDLWPPYSARYKQLHQGVTKWGPARVGFHPKYGEKIGAIVSIALNGEILGLDSLMLDSSSHPEEMKIDFPFIPEKALVRDLSSFLDRSFKFYKDNLSYIGLIDCTIGVTGVEGYRVTLRDGGFSHLLFDDRISVRGTFVGNADEIRQLTHALLGKLRRAAGISG
jgi:hypothetical protein